MDEKAQRFSEECGPYAGMVYRHCLHMLSRPEEAEDAAQRARRRGFGADADGGGQCVDGCVYVCRQEFAHGVVGKGLFYALLGGFSIVLCVSLMALL